VSAIDCLCPHCRRRVCIGCAACRGWTLRLTVDLAHLEGSGWILAGGISGQDPQNSDQLGRWAPNDQVLLPLPDGANTAAHTLTLAPA
jgi:hypothetical protein